MGDKKYTSLGDWAKDTCDAIRSKDGTSEPIAHGDIPDRIKAIPTGSDTSGITATAGDVSENVKFLSKDGVLTQGTMPEIVGEEVTLTKDSPETTIEAGHHDGTGKVKADYSGLADVSGVTAGASDVLSGKTFVDSSGTVTDGSMVDRGAWTGSRTGSGTVTIPAGYHNGSGYVRAYNASTSVDNSNGTTARANHILSGYTCQSNGSRVTGTIVTSSASGMTITPNASGYTVKGDRYLSDDLTIEGDSNLVASNIKSGVSIFGIAGTYEGGSGYGYACGTITVNSSTNITLPIAKKVASIECVSLIATESGGLNKEILSLAFNVSSGESGLTYFWEPDNSHNFSTSRYVTARVVSSDYIQVTADDRYFNGVYSWMAVFRV